MLFDCVQVNTSLGFHWICNRKKERGGICELMMISILNHFSLLRLLVVFDWWKHINMDVTLPFWVIMRSGRRHVMNHIATKGTIFGRRGCGDFFTMSHTATRASSWPYMDFSIVVTSVPGVGLCPHMAYGRVYPYMGPSTPPRVFEVHKMCLTLLFLDAFLLQNSKGSTTVMHQYSKYSKYILNFFKC